MSKQLIDLTGRRYGRLTVIEKAKSRKTAYNTWHTMWLCQCDCGEKVTVWGENLKRGVTKSCGCYRSEASRKRLRAAYDALAKKEEADIGKSV